MATCENYRDCYKATQVICVCSEPPKPEAERHLKFFSATYLSSDFFNAVIPSTLRLFSRVRSHFWFSAKPGFMVNELLKFLREEPSVVGHKVIVITTKLHDCDIAYNELQKKGYATTKATLQYHKSKSAEVVQHFRRSQEFKILVVQGRVELDDATTQVLINHMLQPHTDKYKARAQLVGDVASSGVIANTVSWGTRDAVADKVRKELNV